MNVKELVDYCQSLGFVVQGNLYTQFDILSESCIFEHCLPGTNRLLEYNEFYKRINFFSYVCKHVEDNSVYNGCYYLAHNSGVKTLGDITKEQIREVYDRIKALEIVYRQEQIREVDIECQQKQ